MSRESDDEDCFFVLYDTHPATEMEDRHTFPRPTPHGAALGWDFFKLHT